MKVNQHFEKIKISLLIIFFISCLSSTAEDYDFSIENEDGKMIYYYVIDASEGTCGVMYESHWDFMYKKSGYSGDIVIPEKISYKSKSFTVTEIGWEAFYYGDLNSVTIPESVKYIAGCAFSESTLTCITIPNSVEKMGESVFSNCKSLNTVSLSESCTQIPDNTFAGCTALESFEVPEWISIIGECAFTNCTSLKEIIIPEGVESMGKQGFCTFYSGTFMDCIALEKIILPNTLTLIGNNAFYGCSNLKEVSIGNETTEIGLGAFHGCPLESIYCPCITPPYFYESGINPSFESLTYQDAIVYVPEESLLLYQTDQHWKNFWFINGYAFNGINEINSDPIGENGLYYDLTGRKISNPKSGIYIHNGNKIYIK